MTTFLDQLAVRILERYADRLSETVIVLPSKRARVFLIEALKRHADKTFFSPRIISIEDFVAEMSGLRSLDNVELLFEFYEVYQKIHAGNPIQKFEYFANWAVTILQDFNEIDRYLLSSDAILNYLKDIEVLKRWGLEPGEATPLIANYLQFWDRLPAYYNTFYKHLKDNGRGYQGMIYREAVHNLNAFAAANRKTPFVFAGFNALNQSEEKIFQNLHASGMAEIIWDIDKAFLDNDHHDAGLFIRRFAQHWPMYRTNPLNYIAQTFSQEKDIRIIGTPKSVGQAKVAGSLLQEIIAEGDGTLQHTAVVLGDENLLLPVLHALPESVSALNITMGYPAKNNPVQVLLYKLFRLHTAAVKRSGNGYVMYYKDVLEILTHPLVSTLIDSENAVNTIRSRNYTFITHHKLTELLPENRLSALLFQKWDSGNPTVLESVSEILLILKSNLEKSEEDRVLLAFLFSVFKIVKKLQSYFESHPDESLETLHSLYKQVIELAEVSFEGEPLTGLQVMGVLESRTLDFDTVIITSLNEGTFPAGKSQNSFIPYDVKREYELPTFKEKDAIYTYHFYHLLQRAKRIYLLYNTESEGLDGGEMSRFITQLEVEKMPAHNLSHEIFNAPLPNVAYEPIVIPKTESVLERLKEIADKGFSPSSLTTYIRNPIQFYRQRILRISESDDVEENIALNTLGTIIHKTLEALYQPYIGVIFTADMIRALEPKIDFEVKRQFLEVYKEGETQKGRNLLAFEVAKRNVSNFIKMELQWLDAGDEVQIIALETRYERTIEHPLLPFPVKIAGEFDRLEWRNGRIRIVDYKTGKVEARNVTLEDWDTLADVKHEKIIQVLAYAFLYEPHANNSEIEVGIISFKNMKAGFMPFKFKPAGSKTSIDWVTPEISDDYYARLVELLREILDPEIPFTEVT